MQERDQKEKDQNKHIQEKENALELKEGEGELDSGGQSKLSPREESTLSVAGYLDGYVFGSNNNLSLRRIIGPEVSGLM